MNQISAIDCVKIAHSSEVEEERAFHEKASKLFTDYLIMHSEQDARSKLSRAVSEAIKTTNFLSQWQCRWRQRQSLQQKKLARVKANIRRATKMTLISRNPDLCLEVPLKRMRASIPDPDDLSQLILSDV